jgi:hypothetical protein
MLAFISRLRYVRACNKTRAVMDRMFFNNGQWRAWMESEDIDEEISMALYNRA